MDHQMKPEDLAFREEVRAFLNENLPEDMRFKYDRLEKGTKETTIWWQKILGEKGWLVPSWPKEHGGTGWSLMQHHIFSAELNRAGAPRPSGFGSVMVGPVIYTFGSDEQKERFLPGIRNGTTLWCQGYSEPGSGSDLASLKTSAVLDGDHYVVNGQKIWTTQAHWAEWIFCLVRTNSDGKKQEGISFLLIDMNSPGVEVRPIVSIDNLHHLNEVYFTDVKVPVDNLVGEQDKGWTYAKFLLGNERTATAGTSATQAALGQLKLMTRAGDNYSESLAGDPAFAKKLAELEADLTALEFTELRSLDADDRSFDAVKLSLPLKTLGTQLQQRLAELCVEFMGYGALPVEYPAQGNEEAFFSNGPELMRSHLFGRASTIYGGTSEVQRNIMAKMVLGL